MEADSTEAESLKCDTIPENTQTENEFANLQSPNVQSSQISSCDDDTGQTVESSTDINRSIQNVLNITSSLFGETDSTEDILQEGRNSTEDMLQEGQEKMKNLHVQNSEPGEVSKTEENSGSVIPEEVSKTEENAGSSDIVMESIKLTDKELEHIEESVLRKYTGLNMDLASENQLLKEDVIKCRCELEKYGKRLAAMERKLEKANSYNDDLRVQVEKLSAEVHEYRREKHKIFVHTDTQTSAEDLMEVDDTLYDVNLPGSQPENDGTFAWNADLGGETTSEGESSQNPTFHTSITGDLQTPGMSIADSLKATAEAAMNQTGFVYDQQSGLYYDYSTGYYYNAEKGLYYDPKSGTYFYFNKSTGKYEYHSKVDLSYYTPQTHGYSDRSHGSHHHGYSDKHSDRYSSEHGNSSSGKKKKKKESKRRDSEEKDSKRRDSDDKEPKKKKRKKDKSRDNSEDSDDGKKEKKKRKTSTEKDKNEKSTFDTVVDNLNEKLQDHSDAVRGVLNHNNIVLGELNYKKLKQGDKLLHDSMNKPKVLNENTNVSICDDVLKEDGNRPKKGLVQKGGKKIKLVLKKKEEDASKDEGEQVEKNEMQSKASEKESDKDIDPLKEETVDSDKNKEESSSNKTNKEEKNLNQGIETSEPKTAISHSQKVDEPFTKGVKSQDSERQKENVTEETQEMNEDENENDPANPFLISGLSTDEGMISYNKVGIVNSAEILRICSQLNNEDTDDENDPGKDRDIEKEKSTIEKVQPETEAEPTVAKESDAADKRTNNIDNVTNEMLGVGQYMENLGEKITKIPVKEGDIYSDDDDIMIVEKEVEKVMIELDSDSEDEEKEETSEKKAEETFPGLEPGELVDESSSSSSSSSSLSENQESQPQATWVEIVRKPEPASEESILNNAPCIRAMVTASDILDEGMLFIVTINGGLIGREQREDLVIPVPDINVSKVHAEIRYNSKQQFYTIQDKGSQNGTYVNEERISETKRVSKWVALKHGDTLQLSCTRFDIHIHPGTDTCDKCEPGVIVQKTAPVITTTADSRDKKRQHREQLKSIKKKYGLGNSSYTDNTAAINNPAYKDKASERRRTVGSDHPHTPDGRPASVHRRIDEDNKGHRLLKKLGWTEGESLGKDNAGIQDPIEINIRVDQAAGLGAYGKSNSLSIGNIGIVNARRRFVQTQIRYSQGTSEKNKEKQFEPLMWVQGETQDNSLLKEAGNKYE